MPRVGPGSGFLAYFRLGACLDPCKVALFLPVLAFDSLGPRNRCCKSDSMESVYCRSVVSPDGEETNQQLLSLSLLEHECEEGSSDEESGTLNSAARLPTYCT